MLKLRLALALTLPVAALGTSACDGAFQDFCAALTDCRGGNAADLEACEIAEEATAERAALYGCAEELERLNECRARESICVGELYLTEDRCVEPSTRYNDCVAAAQRRASAP